MTTNCNLQQRPRCVEAVPTVKAMMDRARAAGMLAACTLPGGGNIVDPGIAPHAGEVVDQKQGGPDKFLGDDLDQRLKDHGIRTVILRGMPRGTWPVAARPTKWVTVTRTTMITFGDAK